MKRGREIYFIMTIIVFIVIYLVAYLLGNVTVTIGSIPATVSIFIYPITYFIAILFRERYGKQEVFNLLTYTIFSLIVYALIMTLVGVIPTNNSNELLTIDYRIVFASIAAFFATHMLNLSLYNYLDNNKVFNFLIGATISVTVNAILFIILGFSGTMPLNELVLLFAGEFIVSVVIICLLSLCFRSCVYEVIEAKIKEDEKDIRESDRIIVKEIISKETKARKK